MHETANTGVGKIIKCFWKSLLFIFKMYFINSSLQCHMILVIKKHWIIINV